MATRDVKLERALGPVLACALALFAGVGGCFPENPVLDGECRVVPASILDCRVAGYSGEPMPAGLVGYACSGSMRPDLDATMSEGVPLGQLCADKGLLDPGERAYCCTEDIVTCAYNPADECDPGSYGVQCWGNNRPESLNPSLLCTNGTNERGLYHYCCTGQPEPSPCKESMAVGCGEELLGFLCEGERLPRGEDYGPNRSRADYFQPLCTIARPAPNPVFKSYCCYMPLPVPIGGSCVGHPYVPGCEPGRFGFACYGPDTPEDDYPPMVCPEPGFPGRSAEGYEATLYCCDFL